MAASSEAPIRCQSLLLRGKHLLHDTHQESLGQNGPQWARMGAENQNNNHNGPYADE